MPPRTPGIALRQQSRRSMPGEHVAGPCGREPWRLARRDRRATVGCGDDRIRSPLSTTVAPLRLAAAARVRSSFEPQQDRSGSPKSLANSPSCGVRIRRSSSRLSAIAPGTVTSGCLGETRRAHRRRARCDAAVPPRSPSIADPRQRRHDEVPGCASPTPSPGPRIDGILAPVGEDVARDPSGLVGRRGS